MTERAIPVLERAPLDLALIRESAFAGIDPVATIPKHIRAGLEIPTRIADQLTEDFGEVMAYPKIDLPMYAPLKELSIELFLPTSTCIADEHITLLETNQTFIEAYMVGLNHEFARKLLWREYPTDQRGSYFRQFWDVASYIDSDGLSDDALREQLYDIPELHRWSTDIAASASTTTARPGRAGEQELVLVDPRRAAEEVPDRRHLRAPRRLGR